LLPLLEAAMNPCEERLRCCCGGCNAWRCCLLRAAAERLDRWGPKPLLLGACLLFPRSMPLLLLLLLSGDEAAAAMQGCRVLLCLW
jgi:hypothetical protein